MTPKLFRLPALLLAVFLAMLAFVPARAKAEVSFDFFYDNLSPYGEWVEVGDYGLCWHPTGVNEDWAPYTDGYWAYTDAGWTWVSYEDYGGIVYHYGRWIRTDEAGWCWMPDYEWAPAWVSWRSNDDYVGWAPLPPEAHWRRDVGISIWVDSVCDIGPGYYNFCHVRDFGAPVLRPVLIERTENITIINRTVNITNITYNSGYNGGAVIFNGGPRFSAINAVVAHPIPALKLVQNVNFSPNDWRNHKGQGGPSFGARTVGNQLIVAAPQVTPPADPAALRSHAKLVIGADKVTKGWGIVKNHEQQQEIRQQIQRQAKGFTPESAPAHPVAAADLKVVPTKADPKAVVAGVHDRPAKDQHPEGAVGQTNNNNVPPAGKDRHPEGPAGQVNSNNNVPPGNPNLKPFTLEPGPKSGPQNPSTPKGPVAGPQNPPTSKEPSAVPQNPVIPKGPVAGPQKAPKGSVEVTPADNGRNREEQDRMAREKQAAAQQEAARAKEDDARRREAQAQQQQQQQQQKAMDLRRAEDAQREKEKDREKSVPQPRPNNPPPQPQERSMPPSHNNPPPAGSPPSSNKGHSKDDKGKDKDKDKGN